MASACSRSQPASLTVAESMLWLDHALTVKIIKKRPFVGILHTSDEQAAVYTLCLWVQMRDSCDPGYRMARGWRSLLLCENSINHQEIKNMHTHTHTTHTQTNITNTPAFLSFLFGINLLFKEKYVDVGCMCPATSGSFFEISRKLLQFVRSRCAFQV